MNRHLLKNVLNISLPKDLYEKSARTYVWRPHELSDHRALAQAVVATHTMCEVGLLWEHFGKAAVESLHQDAVRKYLYFNLEERG